MAQLLKTGTPAKPVQFVVTDAAGDAADADALPTGTAVVNGQDDGAITVTVTKPVGTGIYYASLTPTGTSTGDSVQVRIAATIGGVNTHAMLAVGQVVNDAAYDQFVVGDFVNAVRDAILDRVGPGNHDGADTIGKLIQDAAASSPDLSGLATNADMQTILSRTAAGVTVTGGTHLSTDGETLVINQGEAYLDSINNAIEISVTDSRITDDPTADGTTATLRIASLRASSYATSSEGDVVSWDEESSTVSFKFELTSEQSAALHPNLETVYEIDVAVGGDPTKILTPVIEATCEVRRQI